MSSIELSSTGFLNAFVRCGWLLDRIYMHLFMRKVRLTKLEFEETCQRNKLSVNNMSGDKAELS